MGLHKYLLFCFYALCVCAISNSHARAPYGDEPGRDEGLVRRNQGRNKPFISVIDTDRSDWIIPTRSKCDAYRYKSGCRSYHVRFFFDQISDCNQVPVCDEDYYNQGSGFEDYYECVDNCLRYLPQQATY